MSALHTVNIMPAGHKLIGRNALINQIFNAIKTSEPNTNVLLSGPQGIGKTSLCQQLVHNHREDFNDIFWLNGQSSLAEQLSALVAPAYDVPVEDPSWSYQLLSSLEEQPTPSLIFIDNISKAQVESAEFSQLLRLNWHIIATAEQTLDHFEFQFEIEPLTPEEGKTLFLQHNPNLTLTEEQENQLAKSQYHPLKLELQAKLTHAHQLAEDQWTFDPVSLLKAHCTEEQQQLLRLIAIMPYEYYPQQQWIDWFGPSSEQHMLEFEQQGWMEKGELNDKRYFALHPLFRNIVEQHIELAVDATVAMAKTYNQSIAVKANQTWLAQAHCLPQIHALEKALDSIQLDDVEQQNTIDLAKADLLTSQAKIEYAHTHFDKAIALHQQALSLYHHVLGERNDQVLSSLSLVSATYLEKGNQKLGYKLSDQLFAIIDKKETTEQREHNTAQSKDHYLKIIINEIDDEEVVEQVKQKYGFNCQAQILTPPPTHKQSSKNNFEDRL